MQTGSCPKKVTHSPEVAPARQGPSPPLPQRKRHAPQRQDESGGQSASAEQGVAQTEATQVSPSWHSAAALQPAPRG